MSSVVRKGVTMAVSGDRDQAADAMEMVADAADAAADDERRVARQARAVGRLLAKGKSWVEVVDSGAVSRVLKLLRASINQLGAAARRLQVAVAGALVDEGMTTRQIGERFGVTHQRISALLSRRGAP